LQLSEKLNTKQIGKLADLAFLALAHQQLGHSEEAQTTLARLRQVMRQPAWSINTQAQSFPREAAELIEGKGAEKKD
jgi:hypothetical protein